MARPERLELPTLWFEARCSIQLSYGRSHALYLLKGGRDRGARGGKDRGHLGLREGNKAPHHVWIELCATRFDEPAYRFLVRQANAIRTRGNHGVERVDHRDDAGNDWNLRALKAGRISFSVHVFVVVKNVLPAFRALRFQSFPA